MQVPPSNERPPKMSHERMLNEDVPPTIEHVASNLGARAFALWSDLTDHLAECYPDHVPRPDFGGKDDGWAIRYRRGEKTLVTLYPEAGSFTVLVVLGHREVTKANALIGNLSVKVAQEFLATSQLHDGRWLWIRPTSKRDIVSIGMLLRVKHRPTRRPCLAARTS